MNYWVLLPPLLALALALLTKNIIVSLLAGIVSCSVIVHGWGFFPPIIGTYMTEGIVSNLDIFIMLLIFGALLEAIKASGGFAAFTGVANKRIKTARGAKFTTWLLALILGDQAMSTVGVGSVMRPITDKHRVSHEKLGFILSSTGPAMCSMLPWTIFILFYSGMIQAVNPELDGFAEYIKLIPFNFYAIVSILVALLYSLEILPDFGYMKKREQRAKEAGELIRPGSNPLVPPENDMMEEDKKGDIVSFILPFAVSIATVLLMYKQTGMIVITTPFFLGLIVAYAYSIIRGYLKFSDIPGVLFKGAGSMIPIIVILALAFTFGKAVAAVGFSDAIVSIAQGLISPQILPALTFLVCGICAFATGSLVSGLVIFAPISIMLAGSLGANLTLTLAACLGGAMFGDQTSPLSDMVIEPALGAGVDVIDLAKAHFPIKAGFSGIVFVLYLVLGHVL